MFYEWDYNAVNTIDFVLVDSNNSEVTGLGTAFVLQLKKLGGSFVTGTGLKAETGSGWYRYRNVVAEADTLGPVAIKVTHASIAQQNLVAMVKYPVWASPERTLTQAAITAASATLAKITRYRGDTWTIPLTLGDITGHGNIWFSVKSALGDTDAEALVQIDKTGLLYLKGETAGTPGNGSIIVNDESTGDITIILAQAETDDLEPAKGLYYDVQTLIGTTITTKAAGEFVIAGDVTRRIS